MDLASIVIPHYRTPEHLKLCLRCIDRFTPEPHETIVVDNGSDPGTLDDVRARSDLVWIERRQDPGELGQDPHKAALDAGIEVARGRWIVTLHSDTFVLRPGWLRFLIEGIERDERLLFGPATHKLYPRTLWERVRALGRRSDERLRVQPVFTIYRASLFEKQRFSDYPKVIDLALALADSGRVGVLPREEAIPWAFHMGGTTKLENLDHRPTARRRKDRQFERFLARPEIRAMRAG